MGFVIKICEGLVRDSTGWKVLVLHATYPVLITNAKGAQILSTDVAHVSAHGIQVWEYMEVVLSFCTCQI